MIQGAGTWYLLVELNGISATLAKIARSASVREPLSPATLVVNRWALASVNLRMADSEASPMVLRFRTSISACEQQPVRYAGNY